MEAALYIEYDQGPDWAKAWDHIQNLTPADMRSVADSLDEGTEEFFRDNPDIREWMESEAAEWNEAGADSADVTNELFEMLNHLEALMNERWQARDYLRLEQYSVFVFEYSESSTIAFLSRTGVLEAAGLRLAEQP